MKIDYKKCGLLACVTLCLCGIGHTQDDAAKMLLDLLRSGDQDMETAAISMVRDMPGAELTKALAAELPKLSATSQVQLLSALGDRGDVAARPAVVTALKSEDQSVRIAAVRAMGQLGDETAVVLLARYTGCGLRELLDLTQEELIEWLDTTKKIVAESRRDPS